MKFFKQEAMTYSYSAFMVSFIWKLDFMLFKYSYASGWKYSLFLWMLQQGVVDLVNSEQTQITLAEKGW